MIPEANQNLKNRSLPVRKCPVCGGTYFREIEIRLESLPEGSIPLQIPMWVLECLCGALQTPDIGGLRWGKTPNLLLVHFMESLATAQQRRQARADRSLIETAAEESLAPIKKLKKLTAIVRRTERLIARRRAARGADGKIKGGTWRKPKRTAASNGRDLLALEVQRRGFTFDQSRAVVKAIWEIIKDALRRGESVDVPPLGRFSIQESPKPRLRISLDKLQHLHRKSKQVVFQPHPDLGGGSDR